MDMGMLPVMYSKVVFQTDDIVLICNGHENVTCPVK